MNLLDTASLVVTPNGYKASKLYSIIPSNGTGDMTFARTGDTATRVNSSGLIESVTANKPRLDYLGSTCPKLLLEPQRTNIVVRSEELDNASWLKSNATVSANAIASPDGTVDADKIVESATNTTHFAYQTFALTPSTDYTASVYLKAAERTRCTIRFSNLAGANESLVNLATGTTDTGTLTNVGNGWFRFSRTINSSTGVGVPLINIFIANSSGVTSYLGDGTSGLYAWGAQVEAGAYATSYIPTTTASVTRNADSSTKSSISSLIGQTEGTIFVDVNYDSNKIDTSGVLVPLVLSQSTTNSEITLYKTGRVQATHRNSGTLTCNIDLTSYGLTNSRHKIAFAYKLNDFVLYIDGVLAGSDTVGTVGAQDSISLKDTTFPSIGLTNSVALWKTRLTNQELVTLTSL
jgi:hypothetical protein